MWYVIDRRHGRGVVRKYESDAFFAFHAANAWEEEADNSIVAEISVFENLDVVKKFYLRNLMGESEDALRWVEKGHPRFTRLRLLDVVAGRLGVGIAVVEWEEEKSASMEMPTVSPRFRASENRFVLSSTSPNPLYRSGQADGGEVHIRHYKQVQVYAFGWDNQV